MQAKLTVGAVDDRFEREADRVADAVVRSLQRGPAAVRPDDGARIQRHSSGDAPPTPPDVGPAGGDLSSNVAGRIQSSSGRGHRLDDVTRSSMETAFGNDFGDVRVHAASDLAPQIGAEAFTHGSDIHFAPGKYNPQTRSGQWLLSHELTHVVQQRGPSRIAAKADMDTDRPLAATIHQHPTIEPIQRHSSWEHMLIGDLETSELSALGKWQNVDDPFLSVGAKDLAKANVVHVIEQEVRRLKYFQSSPPTGGAADTTLEENKLKHIDTVERAAPDAANPPGSMYDAEWDVRLVSIPMASGTSFMVTYGELNTLGDFFGSVDEMKNMDDAWVDRLIRGVRASTMRELVKIYTKVQGIQSDPKQKIGGKNAKQKAHAALGLQTDRFKSAAGDDDQIKLGGTKAELDLLGSIPGSKNKKKPKVGGDATTDYGSTLARNACHFAPESWLAWGDYHRRAREQARIAYNNFIHAEDPTISAEQKASSEEAGYRLYNEALLHNGFGDHYLQDSYAAGHLINKTQIMHWYVQWLDSNPASWDAHKNKNWRKAQNMAYNQPGLADAAQYDKTKVGGTQQVGGKTVGLAKNPQAAENVGGTWQNRASVLGLTVPGSITDPRSKALLVAWQQKCLTTAKVRKPRMKTVKSLVSLGQTVGLNPSQAKAGLWLLFSDGIVRFDKYSTKDKAMTDAEFYSKIKNSTKMTLREKWEPSNPGKFAAATAPGADAQYEEEALGITYGEYEEYMNSAFIQKATNTLHNLFCEEGLYVASGANEQMMKIYGDNAMLNAHSAEGLKHSSTTAKMSRQAIEDIGWYGVTNIAVNDIADRFPAYVLAPETGNRLSLRDWHNNGELEAQCKNTVFPGMAWGVVDKLAPGAFGVNLGQVSNVHPGEAF